MKNFLLSQTLAHFPLMNLVCVGEIIFLSVFLLSVLWVFRNGSKDFYVKLSNLPMQDGEHNE